MGRENQLVGAFGERAVEAELLRKEWMTSNVNNSIRNAADFDILAYKGARTIRLRIKTCGSGWNAFQFGGFRPDEDIPVDGLLDTDYTICVKMGERRQDDRFYVIPTVEVRKCLSAWRRAYREKPKRDEGVRKDLGHWTLHLTELRSGEDRPSHGFARKWEPYLNKWELLEG